MKIDFNNPHERENWEKEINSLSGFSKKQLRDDDYDKFLNENYPNNSFESMLKKEYRFGNKLQPNIIIYLMKDQKAILYNTITGARFVYIGNKEIDKCFTDAKGNQQRYKSLERVF